MRPTTGGSPRAQRGGERVGARRAGSSATAGPVQLEQRQRPAADARDAVDDASRRSRRRGAARGRARVAGVGVEHREHRERAPRVARGRGRGASVASSAASESLSIRTARASGWRRQARDRRRASPTSSPACGPPRSLSPEKQTTRRAGAHRAAHGGSPASAVEVVGQHARADVVDDGDAERRTAPRSRPPRRSRPCGSSTGGRAGSRRCRRAIAPRVVGAAACGSSCRPRPAARRPGRRPPGSGSRRRSR